MYGALPPWNNGGDTQIGRLDSKESVRSSFHTQVPSVCGAGILPTTWQLPTSLINLSLASNRLYGVLDKAFYLPAKLAVLDLSHNAFAGSVSPPARNNLLLCDGFKHPAAHSCLLWTTKSY